jgi:hypothetical protein
MHQAGNRNRIGQRDRDFGVIQDGSRDRLMTNGFHNFVENTNTEGQSGFARSRTQSIKVAGRMKVPLIVTIH